MALSRLEQDARRIIDRLTALGIRHAIVGGLAVSARTEPRFTRDVDVAVAVASDQEAEQVIRALGQHGFVPATLIEQEATGRIATVRLKEPGGGGDAIVDLLFASSGIEEEVVATADVIELFPGFSVRVASVPSLIALKLLARDDVTRPQDRVDLAALLERTTPTDRVVARELCGLIARRGYDRGRDLVADLVHIEQLVIDPRGSVQPGGRPSHRPRIHPRGLSPDTSARDLDLDAPEPLDELDRVVDAGMREGRVVEIDVEDIAQLLAPLGRFVTLVRPLDVPQRVSAQRQTDAARRRLLARLRSPGRDVRIRTARVLGGWDAHPAIIAALGQLFDHDQDDAVRASAAKSLAILDAPPPLDVLLALCDRLERTVSPYHDNAYTVADALFAVTGAAYLGPDGARTLASDAVRRANLRLGHELRVIEPGLVGLLLHVLQRQP